MCKHPIKLKGDIFYAKCTRNGCDFARERTPIYKYYPENRDYINVLKCPECDEKMELELDFPGREKKEVESKKIIKKIIQYFLPSISCVVVCGVSGRWDLELVRFFRLCMDRGITVYNLNIRNELMREIGLTETNSSFKHIKLDFTKFNLKDFEMKCSKRGEGVVQ